MEKKRATNGKLKTFLKKNVYYIIMGVCLIAIAAMVTVALVTKKDNGVVDVGPSQNVENPPAENIGEDKDPTKTPETSDDSPTIIPTPTVVVFASPVSDVNVIKDYCMDSLVWNGTLKHYAVHKGIDFAGNEGDSVMSAYSGVVSNVTYDVLNGYTVTVTHNDKLTTTYSSLNEPIVTTGQHVMKGEVIGTMGTTATNEYLDGAHVHFCLYENGAVANPYNYLALGDK
ncbi:MAG: peptidoglycan DD-metalloendopeptidase family protein [Christensenellales bacterium]